MFSDPQKIVMQLSLHPGHKVADFGAGSGHYAFALAKLLGSGSAVYAVDVQQDLLTKLKNEAQARGLSNIETIWGNVEVIGGTKLGDASIDAVVVSNLLFQADDKSGVFAEAARILKPGGKLLIVDWSESFGGMGPQPSHVVSKDAARDLSRKAGFREEREIQAGDHHYGIIFAKS